jgi:DHA1 family bicyclomycin/chloramphenicol resistance-like MFS transporter
MSMTSSPTAPRLSQPEFIALMAMLFAMVAFSIDSMLPALPEIARELSPDAPNAAQLILTAFVLGMGIGTLFTGPLSDSYGRKRVIIFGAVLYSIGAVLAYVAPTLETVLAARMIQGLGAAAPRIAAIALVRDLYKGRDMARIVSFTMMIFTLVPAVAPFMGQGIIAIGGWRSIFLAFVAFALVACLWLGLRQPETLPPEARRKMSVASLWSAAREVMSHRVILISIAVQTLVFSALFATLSTTQPIFDQTFGQGDNFPMWFAVIALCGGTSSFLNSRLVGKLGMRRMVTGALVLQVGFTAVMLAALLAGVWPPAMAFGAHLVWTIGVFYMVGPTVGNLNALALEPVGHIAGMAASITAAIATIASVLLAAPVGLMFDGTAVPLMAAILVFSALGVGLMRMIPR